MEMISGFNLPWLAIGDFNVVTSIEEKVGGKTPNKRAMMDFNNCLDICELMQAPKTGLQHSWPNCQHGSKRILCNLDRAVFNQLWLHKFNGWGYKVGLRIALDHAPLLGGCASIPKPHNTPMRFQKIWISHPTFMEVVEKCCSEEVVGDPAFLFQTKLKKLKRILKDWNWTVFGDINVQIEEAEVKVQEAMVNSDNNPSDEELLSILVSAQNLQARNTISELEVNNGDIISDQEKFSEELVKYFENKFKFQEVKNIEHMVDGIPEVLTSDDQNMSEAIRDENEIKDNLFAMDPESAPGSDGFSGCFYKACWHIINKDVVNAIQFCWKRKFIPKRLNSKFLVLLPKIEGARISNPYRPIGLSNVSFKIFTKIMATRMGLLMHKLVSPQQASYVKGRCIQDRIMLASEMINEIVKKRRCGNVGLKLDISQAYDSVSWEFLFKAGIETRGLFVLMVEALSRRLTQMVDAGLIIPMVERKGIHPAHLLFADDVLIFCNGAKKSILNLMKLLEDYQKCFGQIINKQKSKIFIDGASELRKSQLKEMIQIERNVFPDKYLRVILCVVRAKYKDKNGQWSSKWQLSSIKIGYTSLVNDNIQLKISDIIADGVWSLLTKLQEIISNGQLPEICGGEDVLIWTEDLKDKFSVPEALNKIRHKEREFNWSKYIWNSFLHPSTASNVWKIIQGVYTDDTTMISNGYEIFIKRFQWNPLKIGFVMFCCDGSSFGNPGAAGFGVFVRDSDCQVVATLSGGIRIASNYLAQTYDVMNVMELAVQWEMQNIIIVSDSKTVIAEFSQGNAPWFIKGRWLKAIRQFKQIRYMHCYREVNFSAYNIAKRGASLDAGERKIHIGRP
ncbi:uncharacterized protein LOC113330711 [Papaver somniferum]|uniref:uncharacterized protein LOC113330711 n=1 Tax=Papaver somniferum TaxID=3469 RepID=UPI000E6FB382|nr:uncharacterized protein LOC113330711 [Papaver somniferum]